MNLQFSNNFFYKTLSVIGTLGIVVLSTTQVWNAMKNQTNQDPEISKTLIEIKKARKDALDEVELFRSKVLKELNSLRTDSLNEIKGDRSAILAEVKTAKEDALKSISKASGGEEGSVWLVLRLMPYIQSLIGAPQQVSVAMVKIEMENMTQCELQGAKWNEGKIFGGKTKSMGYVCIKGK